MVGSFFLFLCPGKTNLLQIQFPYFADVQIIDAYDLFFIRALSKNHCRDLNHGDGAGKGQDRRMLAGIFSYIVVPVIAQQLSCRHDMKSHRTDKKPVPIDRPWRVSKVFAIRDIRHRRIFPDNGSIKNIVFIPDYRRKVRGIQRHSDQFFTQRCIQPYRVRVKGRMQVPELSVRAACDLRASQLA